MSKNVGIMEVKSSTSNVIFIILAKHRVSFVWKLNLKKTLSSCFFSQTRSDAMLMWLTLCLFFILPLDSICALAIIFEDKFITCNFLITNHKMCDFSSKVIWISYKNLNVQNVLLLFLINYKTFNLQAFQSSII